MPVNANPLFSNSGILTRVQRPEALIGSTLVAVTFLIYSRCLACPFVYFDDPVYVSENRQVQAGLTVDSIRWAFTTFACANWHPLTWLSLQLDAVLYGGLNARGFHLTNVLLHTMNTLLLFLVLDSMTGAAWRSAVVAGLFALHPMHVESVAWVAERKDVLSTLFWMLTLAAYLHYVRRPRIPRFLLVALTLGLGLLAKPMLVTLPGVLLLLDYWPLRRWPAVALRCLFLEKVPLFFLVLVSSVITVVAQRQGQAMATMAQLPLDVRIWNALLAHGGYLSKMLYPLNLAVYYPHPDAAVSVMRALGAGLLLGVLTVLVLGPGRRWPYLAVGWLWYLGTLVPVIGLVQVGGQALADRYSYVPLIGLFLMVTWGMADLATALRVPHLYLGAIAAAVLSACGILTWIQEGYWQGTLDIWEHALAVTANNAVAHNNLGMYYHRQGLPHAAQREFENALRIDARYVQAHVNLGTLFRDLGRGQQAEAEFRKAIALQPGEPMSTFGLAIELHRQDRLEEALVEFRKAIALDSAEPLIHNYLGNLLRDLGRDTEAAAAYRKAIALDKEYASPHVGLGDVLADQREWAGARAEYCLALNSDAKDAQAHNALGMALQADGRLREAMDAYRRALDLGLPQARPRLRACERLNSVGPLLSGMLAGCDQPRDNAERLALADLCRQPFVRRYALAARLYTDAFSAEPTLADDLRERHRFNAARAAALAGCGHGQDAARLDDYEKARLRRQALSWLQSELLLLKTQARGDRPPAHATLRQVLRLWQRTQDLAEVRDQAALAKLPDGEREAWQQLWQKVQAR
jgi:tetratricopeptide (TPR) repeat protein